MKRVLSLLCFLLAFAFCDSALSQWGPARIIKSARDTMITIAPYYYNRQIATDTFGRVHVVWTQFPIDSSGRQPVSLYYMRSTDKGTTWESPFLLTQAVQNPAEPTISADGLGNVHVVWMEEDPGVYYGAFYRRSTDGGRSWEPETLLVVSTDGYPEPLIAADEKGIVHLVWTVPQPPNNVEVGYKRSSDGGKTWSPDTFLTNSPFWNQNVSLALDSKGRPHISWNEVRGFLGPIRIWYKSSSDGGLTWNPSVLIADSDSTLTEDPNIAIDGLDRVYVFFTAYCGSKQNGTWERQIVYRVSKDTGQTFGPRQALTVYPDTPLVAASITADLKGGVHVVWNDYKQQQTNYLVYNGSTDGGLTWRYNPPFSLTDSSGGASPSLTSDPTGRVHLVYRSGTSNPTFTSWIIYRSGYPLGVEVNPKDDFVARDLARLEVYPNPVTSAAYLRVQVPSGSKSSLKIFDVTGRLVRVLSSNLNTPKEVVVWDGKDGWGRPVPSGVYLCRLEGGGMERRQKTLVLIR